MKCCGEQRITPFCPECGKQLSDGNLFGLLRFVRNHQKLNTKAFESLRDSETDYPSKSDRLEAKERVVAKWKSWGDQLEQLIKDQSYGSE